MNPLITLKLVVNGVKVTPFFSKEQAQKVALDNNGSIYKIKPETTDLVDIINEHDAYLVINSDTRYNAQDNKGQFTVTQKFIDDLIKL